MPEYIQVTPRALFELPYFVELDEASEDDLFSETTDEISGWYVDGKGKRAERCEIHKSLAKAIRRAVLAPDGHGLVAVRKD